MSSFMWAGFYSFFFFWKYHLIIVKGAYDSAWWNMFLRSFRLKAQPSLERDCRIPKYKGLNSWVMIFRQRPSTPYILDVLRIHCARLTPTERHLSEPKGPSPQERESRRHYRRATRRYYRGDLTNEKTLFIFSLMKTAPKVVNTLYYSFLSVVK